MIAATEDLDRDYLQAKERRLIEIVKAELKTGRRCHVMWNMKTAMFVLLKQVLSSSRPAVALRQGFGTSSNSMDHCRFTYYAPAISSASRFEDERGHVCQFGPWKGEGSFLHLLGERDPRFALAVQDHPGIRLRRVCKEFAMAKLDIHESLLAAPNL